MARSAGQGWQLFHQLNSPDTQGCQVLLTREASGYHIYFPCPSCLESHGKSELRDPKFAINASKYLALGDNFRDLSDLKSERGTFNPFAASHNVEAQETRNMKSGICMRTRQSKEPHRFSVTELLQMSTITERHPDIQTSSKVVGGAGSAERLQHWEKNPVSGILCPPPPGEVVPITDLPSDHRAVEYLTERGFNLEKLWEQFRCNFCVKEYPYGKNGIYYRKMPGGWMDTPQNRIIFEGPLDAERVGPGGVGLIGWSVTPPRSPAPSTSPLRHSTWTRRDGRRPSG